MTHEQVGLGGGVAVVTGAAGGIGSALVGALAAQGVLVGALDLALPRAGDVRLACDVTDERAVGSAIAEISRELGSVGMLVCAAGVVSECPIGDLSTTEWRRVVDVSLLGTFLAIREVLPDMVSRAGGGRIVAFSSGYASKGYAHGAHYAAGKAGVEALVKSAALEVAGEGVTVNAVAPGPVSSGMIDHHLSPARVVALEGAIPLGRIADPSDVVGSVMFLLSDAAAYVTGQVLHVNGGLLMG